MVVVMGWMEVMPRPVETLAGRISCRCCGDGLAVRMVLSRCYCL